MGFGSSATAASSARLPGRRRCRSTAASTSCVRRRPAKSLFRRLLSSAPSPTPAPWRSQHSPLPRSRRRPAHDVGANRIPTPAGAPDGDNRAQVVGRAVLSPGQLAQRVSSSGALPDILVYELSVSTRTATPPAPMGSARRLVSRSTTNPAGGRYLDRTGDYRACHRGDQCLLALDRAERFRRRAGDAHASAICDRQFDVRARPVVLSLSPCPPPLPRAW